MLLSGIQEIKGRISAKNRNGENIVSILGRRKWWFLSFDSISAEIPDGWEVFQWVKTGAMKSFLHNHKQIRRQLLPVSNSAANGKNFKNPWHNGTGKRTKTSPMKLIKVWYTIQTIYFFFDNTFPHFKFSTNLTFLGENRNAKDILQH